MITSNAEDIIKNIDKFVKVQAKNLEQALDEVGLRGVAIVKGNTPVISSRLKNSMSYTVDGKVVGQGQDILHKSQKKKTVIIGTNVEYAPKVEFLSQNESKGFMLKSYSTLKPIARKIFKTVLGRGLK